MTGTGPTILLVEDNPDDEMLARRAFGAFGAQRGDGGIGGDATTHRMTVARDGRDAIRLITGDLPVPALVLLDLNLPEADGFQVLEAIRNHAPAANTPVVILTSSSDSQDITRAYALGANSYITKPVDFAKFMEVVCDLSEYWLVLNADTLPASAGTHDPRAD